MLHVHHTRRVKRNTATWYASYSKSKLISLYFQQFGCAFRGMIVGCDVLARIGSVTMSCILGTTILCNTHCYV